MNDPRVGVVTITRNRRDEVTENVQRLLALPERPRIVVVDNASVDGTAEALRETFGDVDDVELIVLSRNAGAAGRNLGVRRIETPYVAFADDDSWWAPGSLSRAADLFDAHPRLALVTARILVGDAETTDAICDEMAASPLPRPPDVPGAPLLSFLAGASIVRRDAFLAAGGFEPRLVIGGEEELLAMDLATAGWAMSYIDDVSVHHRASKLRDPAGRRRVGIRNTLWVAWLRRPLPGAARHSLDLLHRLPADRVAAGGVAAALAGLPWVMRHRRVVPPDVERGLRTLAASQRRSTARQYRH